MSLLKKTNWVYSNDMPYEEKKAVCKKLNEVFYRLKPVKGSVVYEDLYTIQDLMQSIRLGEVLSEEQVLQVNKVLNLRLTLNWW